MNHDELPLPEYDHIPTGHLPARISALDADAVQQLLDYEREHGNRLPVVQVLEQRVEALKSGTVPSGSLPTDLPEMGAAPRGGDQVSPDTSGPPVNPPAHGVPTNPTQPRR